MNGFVEGAGGNREVSPYLLLTARVDLGGAGGAACPREGGAWGKQGFPHATEPKAREEAV